MPSMGLANYQGRKNANDLLRDNVSTVAQFYKSAAEADMAKEYFSPLAEEEREFSRTEKKKILKNQQEFSALRDEMAVDPKGAIGKYLKNKTGNNWVLDEEKTATGQSTGRLTLVELGPDGRRTGRGSVYSSMADVMDTLATDYFTNTPQYAATQKATHDAEIAAANKLNELRMKGEYDLEGERIAGRAKTDSASIFASGGIREAEIHKTFSEKELWDNIRTQALNDKGYFPIKTPDGGEDWVKQEVDAKGIPTGNVKSISTDPEAQRDVSSAAIAAYNSRTYGKVPPAIRPKVAAKDRSDAAKAKQASDEALRKQDTAKELQMKQPGGLPFDSMSKSQDIIIQLPHSTPLNLSKYFGIRYDD